MKKWFKSKVNEIGEKAVDSMVNLIFSKNDTPMNYFNQNPLINAITKSVNSRFTVKQSNTKLVDDKLERYPAICDFDLLVTEGIFLLVSDGSMAHTKYFSNTNKATSSKSSSASSNTPFSNLDSFRESEHPDSSVMGPIRHTMIVDEKKNKIEFDSIGPVKPNFCKYRLEIGLNNRRFFSERRSMQDDFNRVIFDYCFTGKVYNINTDVLISLWCELDINKYESVEQDDIVYKKQIQPRKISSVQCPSIYAPRISSQSYESPNNVPNGLIPDESPESNLSEYQNGLYSASENSYITPRETFSNTKYTFSNTNHIFDKDNSDYNNNNHTTRDNSPTVNVKKNKKEKSKSKKDKKDVTYTSDSDKDSSDMYLELMVGKEPRDKLDKDKDKNSYSRRLGRAVLSIPLILSSFGPEGSLDIHEDLKFLIKYSKKVLSVNFDPSKQEDENVSETEFDHSDSSCHTDFNQDYHKLETENKGVVKEGNNGIGNKESRYKIRSCFWLQLFPFNENDDFKFIRPYCGYHSYGMRNPGDSIGFLLVSVQLTFEINPTLLPILNNLVPLGYEWIIPKNFEMVHFYSLTDRLYIYLYNVPIWITRLLLGGTQIVFNPNFVSDCIRKKFKDKLTDLCTIKDNCNDEGNNNKNSNDNANSLKDTDSKENLESKKGDDPTTFFTYKVIQLDGIDLLFIIPFWFLIYELIAVASLWKMPLILYLLIVLVMIYYKVVMDRFTAFGDRLSVLKNLQRSGILGDFVGVGRTKYKSCTLFTSDDSKLYNVEDLLSSSIASTPVTTPNTPNLSSNLAKTSPIKDKIKEQSKEINQENEQKSEKDQKSGRGCENSAKHGKDGKEKYNYSTNSSRYYPMKDDKFNNSLFENHLYKRFNLINRSGVTATDSLVVTPFGKYKLNFLGLGEEYPIFFDDFADFDLKELVKDVLLSLKYIQRLLGYICITLEKIRFSLDTGFYQTTVLTLFMLSVTLLPLTLFLKLLSRFSLRTFRFILFLSFFYLCMKRHFKLMLSDLFYLSRKVRNFTTGSSDGTSRDNNTNMNLLGSLFDCPLRAGKGILWFISEFYKNWLKGLPDHREIDHRKICALQALPSLCHLLPKEHEIDWRYYRRQFENHYKVFGNNSENLGIDLKTYARCKSLVERTILEEYLSNNLPVDLSGD
ncbi:putative integral membrane protein [Theileria parva strain Muguga]|uniref:Uncharacterized protein n=1 Tax=Theileria parva TaxID=5875 RepID=Q4MZC1_THEPA|nr:putative integral membrane protein [Theileria parva strain Muguga]EAN31353.1 putative integral membrane protein [Theileria parva strain Muguga]|eukprot:XP_763636.1 hypothetical protein [Theileria parva strain Muguga]